MWRRKRHSNVNEKRLLTIVEAGWWKHAGSLHYYFYIGLKCPLKKIFFEKHKKEMGRKHITANKQNDSKSPAKFCN